MGQLPKPSLASKCSINSDRMHTAVVMYRLERKGRLPVYTIFTVKKMPLLTLEQSL
jgi:hypothetical protein